MIQPPRVKFKGNTPRSWKNWLPSYFRLDFVKFDVPRVLEEIAQYRTKFTNVLESNKALCLNNPKLVASVYDHYEQISLTEFDGTQNNLCSVEKCLELAENAGSKATLSNTAQYKLKTSKRFDIPEMDERNYNRPTDLYKNSYIQSCIKQFPGEAMRVRLVKLAAGKKVDWHIDYDPSFATRLIVPLETNPLVKNFTNRKNKIEEIHLPADGFGWFLNTGFSHSVVNEGETDRVILMFSLNGDELLRMISDSWLSGNPNLSNKSILS